MNNLPIQLGLLNASRNAQRAQELQREQIEEARKATDQAKRATKLEEQRLAIEKERFEAEEDERSQRQRIFKRQKKAREILADAIIEFGEIATSAQQPHLQNKKMQITRQVAVVQAKISVLDGIEDAFTELSDISEFRKLKTQITKFIQAGTAKGECHANPLEYTEAEVQQLYQFAENSAALYNVYDNFGVSLLNAQSSPISYQEWITYWEELHILEKTLSTRLKELSDTNNPTLWIEARQPSPELLELDAFNRRPLKKNSRNGDADATAASFALELANWHLFSLEEGPAYNRLTTHLEDIRFHLGELYQQYEVDKLKWDVAASIVSTGDYLLAKKMLAECSNRVVDDNYERCTTSIKTWEGYLDGFVQELIMLSLDTDVLKAMSSFPLSIPKEVKHRRQLLSQAKSWIDAQRSVAISYINTDFGAGLTIALDQHDKKVKSVTAAFDQQVVRHYIKIVLIAAVVVMIFMGAMVFYFKIQRRNLESDKTAAIELQKAQQAEKDNQIAEAERERNEREAEMAKKDAQARRAEEEKRHAEVVALVMKAEEEDKMVEEKAKKSEDERKKLADLNAVASHWAAEKNRIISIASSESSSLGLTDGLLYGKVDIRIPIWSYENIVLAKGTIFSVIRDDRVDGTICVRIASPKFNNRDDLDRYNSDLDQLNNKFSQGINVPAETLTADPSLQF